MTLKSKKILWLVISLILTAGFFVLLYFAFELVFPIWSTLTLLGVTVVTMLSWVFFYMAHSKLIESLNPKKKKYHKKGNRKESRRKGL